MTRAPIPILRSFSEAEAKRFYLDYLGFELLFEHRFAPGLPLYFGVSKGMCELHLSEHHGDASPGAALRIEVDDVTALRDRLTAAPHPRAAPGLVDQPFGFREMALIDPFHNRLIFCQKIGGSAS